MGYYSKEQLLEMGVRHVGDNVKISKKVSIYEPEKMYFDDNCRVDDFCVLSGKVRLGKNVHIAVFCNVAGGDEGVIMEDFSGLAYYSNVFTRSDDYSGKSLTNPTIPEQYKYVKKQKVVIGRHSIVGASSIIFPGVILAEGTSVGAMTLVTKNTEPWKIYVGVPAKVIGDRSKELLEFEKIYKENYN
ncbi:acyltransferase [Clostridium perfringens]